MKSKHDYDSAAVKRKELEEKFLLKSQEAKAKREEKATLKAEQARIKEAKQKEYEEKAALKEEKVRVKAEKARVLKIAKEKEREEKKAAQQAQILSFDFNRDVLGGGIYCGKCNKVFTSDEEREKHEKKHDDPKSFVCSNCDKTFKKMENKDMHERRCGKKTQELARDVANDDNEQDEEVVSLISSAFCGAVKLYQMNFAPGIRNLHLRLQKAMIEASDQLLTMQRNNEIVRYYISVQCNFHKPTEPDIVTDPPVVFNSGSSILLASSNITEQMEINYKNILHSIEEYVANGSGWVLLNLASLDINASRYNPTRATY